MVVVVAYQHGVFTRTVETKARALDVDAGICKSELSVLLPELIVASSFQLTRTVLRDPPTTSWDVTLRSVQGRLTEAGLHLRFTVSEDQLAEVSC